MSNEAAALLLGANGDAGLKLNDPYKLIADPNTAQDFVCSAVMLTSSLGFLLRNHYTSGAWSTDVVAFSRTGLVFAPIDTLPLNTLAQSGNLANIERVSDTAALVTYTNSCAVVTLSGGTLSPGPAGSLLAGASNRRLFDLGSNKFLQTSDGGNIALARTIDISGSDVTVNPYTVLSTGSSINDVMMVNSTKHLLFPTTKATNPRLYYANRATDTFSLDTVNTGNTTTTVTDPTLSRNQTLAEDSRAIAMYPEGCALYDISGTAPAELDWDPSIVAGSAGMNVNAIERISNTKALAASLITDGSPLIRLRVIDAEGDDLSVADTVDSQALTVNTINGPLSLSEIPGEPNKKLLAFSNQDPLAANATATWLAVVDVPE